jgi:hypothetical protein
MKDSNTKSLSVVNRRSMTKLERSGLVVYVLAAFLLINVCTCEALKRKLPRRAIERTYDADDDDNNINNNESSLNVEKDKRVAQELLLLKKLRASRDSYRQEKLLESLLEKKLSRAIEHEQQAGVLFKRSKSNIRFLNKKGNGYYTRPCLVNVLSCYYLG